MKTWPHFSVVRVILMLAGCALFALAVAVASSGASFGEGLDGMVRKSIWTTLIGAIGLELALGALTLAGDGEYLLSTPKALILLNGVVMFVLLGAFGSYFLWEGAGPGERHFTSGGGVMLGPIHYSWRDADPERGGRIAFTIAGTLIWMIALAIAAYALTLSKGPR